MHRRIFITAVFALYAICCFCQNEGNNWYFGSYAGLNFSTAPPTILNNGHLTTSEGCAAVSSKTGALLFYTDGTNVWDANHNVMPNGTGLFGDPSSTQSAVICPKPGTYNYSLDRFDGYFIVTIDAVSGPNGVRFSEVDMTLNGSMGDVVAANKNTLLFGTTTVEGANVARHANGCDYWIVGKEVGNTTFKVYSITAAGVNMTPVISNAGSVTPAGWGNVKVSPNNQLIGLANSNIGTQVFDFNNNTGALTFKFSDGSGGYSLEFSADNNLLYSAILNDPNIYQFDLNAVNNAAFQASKTIIGATSNTIGYRMCALQMAPNGKIYAALQGLNYIGVINFPNIQGTGCNYVDNGQSIAGVNTFSGTNMSCVLGLPAFPSFFTTQKPEILSKHLCFSDQTEFQLSDTSLVNLIEWTITDLNLLPVTQSTAFEPVFQFADTGSYLVSAIVHYPCYIDSSVIDTVTIVEAAPVALGADTLLCTGDNILLDAGAGYDYYLWSSGDTTQTISVNATGAYSVLVSVQNEDSLCTESDAINITAYPVPTAWFSFTYECLGTPTSFTDLSDPNGGTITNWDWDFDNDGTGDAATQNALNTFSGAGTFPVNLEVSTAGGACPHDTTINITVNPMPVAGFTFSDACTGDSVFFTDASTISSGAVASFGWDFGDGPPAGTSTLQNPAYAFSSPGTFIVVLTATSDSGCADVQGNSITIFPLPMAAFNAPGVCLYNDAVFADSSSVTGGTINAWQWDFGDGNTSTTQNPLHAYGTDATYVVSLIVTSDNNCSDTLIQPIDIYPIPLAGFSASDVCRYDPAIFSDASSVSSGSITSWYWQYDDGNTSTLQNPTHLYSADGTYDVSLLASSDNNCVDTSILSLTIYPVPVPDFSTADVCLYDPAVFADATTINAPGSIAGRLWDFGDGAGTSTAQNPSYSYMKAGIYNVTLTAISADGCTEDTVYPVEIYPVPVAAFTADALSGCEPLCVTFTDGTSISGGGVSAWSWDFGDGNLSSGQSPANCYSAVDESTALQATVTLVATSSSGCTDTLSLANMISVWPRPIAGFTAGPQPTTILAPAIDFTDLSLGNVTTWSWDFGDGDTLMNAGPGGANPAHVYLDTGTYLVQQITGNMYLCADTFRDPVTIDADYILHVPNCFSPNGDGINETFIPQGVGLDANSFELLIYNRWGDLVFETRDVNVQWDGTVNNGRKGGPESVYVWLIQTVDLSGKKHKYTGHVTLLR